MTPVGEDKCFNNGRARLLFRGGEQRLKSSYGLIRKVITFMDLLVEVRLVQLS